VVFLGAGANAATRLRGRSRKPECPPVARRG